MKPLLFDYIGAKFGKDSLNQTITCPGEGVCERFTGTEGDTPHERFEHASPGCRRKCQRLALAADKKLSSFEEKTICEHIENLVTEHNLRILNVLKCELWEIELLKFWEKTSQQMEINLRLETLERIKRIPIIGI